MAFSFKAAHKVLRSKNNKNNHLDKLEGACGIQGTLQGRGVDLHSLFVSTDQ